MKELLFAFIGGVLTFFATAAWDYANGYSSAERTVYWVPAATQLQNAKSSQDVKEAIATAEKGLRYAKSPDVKLQLRDLIEQAKKTLTELAIREDALQKEQAQRAAEERAKQLAAEAIKRKADDEAAAQRKVAEEAARAAAAEAAAKQNADARAKQLQQVHIGWPFRKIPV